jgi:hypothetical protein
MMQKMSMMGKKMDTVDSKLERIDTMEKKMDMVIMFLQQLEARK